jgi:hypothetical protein
MNFLRDGQPHKLISFFLGIVVALIMIGLVTLYNRRKS